MIHMKALPILLAALLLVSATVAPTALALDSDGATVVRSPFIDLAGDDRAVEAFALLYALEIFEGYGDGRVGPDNTLTRAQFAKVAVSVGGYEKLAEAMATQRPAFTDADLIPAWSWGWVNAAYSLGLVIGRPDGRFDPNAPVTYAEGITMLLRGEGYGGFINPWPAAAIEKARDLGITRDLARQMDTTPAFVLSRRNMAFITARSMEVHPPSATDIGMPDEDQPSRRQQLALTGTVEAVGADHIVLDEDTLDLADTVAFFGASHLTEIVGVRVEVFLNSAEEVAYITADPRFRVEDIFVEWTEDGHILLADGRALIPVPDEKLLIAINGGEPRGKADEDIKDYAALKKLLMEDDELRLALDDRGRVERIDAYRDTHVDAVLTGITPAFDDFRAGHISLRDSDGKGYTFRVTDRTQVTVDGELVGLARVEEEIYDRISAYLIATVRAADDDAMGGLDVHAYSLSILARNTVEGTILSLGEDDDGKYAVIGGLRYYYDPGHLSGGPTGDFNTGDYVKLLLGSDDVARVMLEGPSGANR